MSLTLVLLIVLSACQGSNNNTNNDNNNDNINNNTQTNNNNNTEEEEEDPYAFSVDPYEVEKEPAGDIFKTYIADKETADDDIYEEAEEEAIEAFAEEVKAFDDEEKADPDLIAGFAVNTLSTSYQEKADAVRNFDIGFDEIELPDGRKLNTVKKEDLEEKPPETNVAVILDASGSMKAEVPGGEKMKLARESLKTFTDSLADYVNVALYVFGHEGSSEDADKELSCSTIDNIYELGKYDGKKFDKALNSFDAKGWTPIADSLSLVRDDLVKETDGDTDTKNIIYLISDGIETCDGDPVEVVSDIKEDIDNVTINIIGFDVDDATNQLLKDIAEAGNGQYNVAQNEAQLSKAIKDQWHQKISKGKLAMWSAHRVIDIQSRANKLYDEFDNDYGNPLKEINNREKSRLDHAIKYLIDEEIIEFDLRSDINKKLQERNTALTEHIRNVRSNKRDRIWDEAMEMKDIVNMIEDEMGED